MNKYIKDPTDYSNNRYRIEMNKLKSNNYEMPNNEEILQILNGGIILNNKMIIKIYQLESDYQNNYTYFEYITQKKHYKALYWIDYNKQPELVADTELGNFDNSLIEPVSIKYKNKSKGRTRILRR